MAATPRPINEAARLAALRRYSILDSGPEAAYDALVKLAANIAGTPIALISLVDEDRQWFKAVYGLEGVTELPRDAGFCANTILYADVFEIHDAREDSRFSGDTLVAGDQHIRFYAGVPLTTDDGFALGALCVMDRHVGWLSGDQTQQLKLLARAIVDLIQTRAQAEPGYDTLSVLSGALEDAAEIMIVADATVPPEGWPKILAVNNEFVRQLGYEKQEVIGETTAILFGDDTDPRTIETIAGALSEREASLQEFIAYRKDGSSFIMETHSRGVFDSAGRYLKRVILARDVTDRRDSEAELRALRALIDEATDFIFTTDATPTWLGGPFVTYVNNALLRATGYTAEELAGKSPSFLYGPDSDKNVIQALITHIDNTEAAGYEIVIYKKDGTPFWVEFNGRPILDPATNSPLHWIAVGRDITIRRQTQQQLAVLSTAIEAANDCIVVYEVDPHRDNAFRVVFVNDATVAQSGFTREELMNGPTGSGPDTDEAAVAEFRASLGEGDAARARLRLYRKDGSAYWGEISAQPIKNFRGEITHIVSIERDVTDMMEREQQLQSDNETLSALMQISRELFGVLSSESLRATFLSGIQSLTGIKPLEHVGLIATADPFLQRASTSKVPVVDRSRHRAAFSISGTSDAPPAVVEINAAALERRLERNVILALQLLVQNYRTASQNTALYEEIEDRRAAVIELNQTKSDLIAMLAHDFRGPLTSIMGFSELLRAEDLPRDEQEDFLDTIISSAQRLSSLANDTLAMSNLEENELSLVIEPVDYVALANKAAEIYGEERTITITADPPKITGRADRARLRQVFDNLIGNAVKYSPEGGDVCVELRKIDDRIEIRVSDRGIGIPGNEIDRIFTRFSRASNARASGISGTGFGLYLTRQIAERHGGTVHVESVLGKGSTFVIELPVTSGVTGQRLRVLLGDHAGNIRSFTAHTLRSNGYAVKVCETWRELEHELSVQPYDLAVVDVETFRTGVPTVQRFLDAANATSVPVIVIGAKRSEQLEGYAATLGKPYLAADLLATVHRLDSQVLSRVRPGAKTAPAQP
ncbi:MAG: PAS domain S-box protein [Candidatus Baltobacteraceae bacterium]